MFLIVLQKGVGLLPAQLRPQLKRLWRLPVFSFQVNPFELVLVIWLEVYIAVVSTLLLHWGKLPYLLWVQHVKGRTSPDVNASWRQGGELSGSINADK